MYSKNNFKKWSVIFIKISLCLFLFNSFFILTDFLAGKSITVKEFFHSSIDNEYWLAFWGTFFSGLITYFLLKHYQVQLEFEKKKHTQELLLNKLKEEKEIFIEILTSWDPYTLLESTFSNGNLVKNHSEYSKNKNLLLLKLGLLGFRIEDPSGKLKEKNKIYNTLKKLSEDFEKARKLAFEYSKTKTKDEIVEDNTIIEYSKFYFSTLRIIENYYYTQENIIINNF